MDNMSIAAVQGVEFADLGLLCSRCGDSTLRLAMCSKCGSARCEPCAQGLGREPLGDLVCCATHVGPGLDFGTVLSAERVCAVCGCLCTHLTGVRSPSWGHLLCRDCAATIPHLEPDLPPRVTPGILSLFGLGSALDVWVPVLCRAEASPTGSLVDVYIAVCVDPSVAFRTMVVVKCEDMGMFGVRMQLGELMDRAVHGTRTTQQLQDVLVRQEGYPRAVVTTAFAGFVGQPASHL